MEKSLAGIEMGRTWLSYIGSVYGILKHAKMWEGDVCDLAGYTGMAFQFIVNEELCPSSVTVYDWDGVHFMAMDRIGVYTDHVSGWNTSSLNTGTALMEDARRKIRESIDRGIGVLVWTPTQILEFGIIKGYDEKERVFEVLDCANPNPDPLLYDNLGKSEVSMLYVQRFFSKIEPDKEKLVRDCLSFATDRWQWTHFDPKYRSGARAYDAFAGALAKGKFNEFGLTYVANVYADTKKAIATFMDRLGKEGAMKGLGSCAELYAKVAENFGKMAEMVPFRGPNPPPVDKKRIPDLIRLSEESGKLEAKAMTLIRESLEA